jgi:hypothetical protein
MKINACRGLILIMGIFLAGVVGAAFINLAASKTPPAAPVVQSAKLAAPVTAPPAKTPVVPAVDAEIVAIYPSPDYTRVALSLGTATDPSVSYPLIVFDPNRKRICALAPAGLHLRAWGWSPDSRRLALIDTNGKLSLLERDGGYHVVPNTSELDFIMWRPDKPDWIIDRSSPYAQDTGEDPDSGRGPWFFHETNIRTGQGRRIPLKHRYLWRYLVRGKLCIAYWARNKQGRIDYRAVHIAQVKPWRHLFDIPLYNHARYDISDIDISPNGKYFTCFMRYSGATLNMVARVQDARTVFRKPLQAIFWRDDIFGELVGADWLQDSRGHDVNRSDNKVAIIGSLDPDPSSYDFPLMVDLTTGSWHNVMWDPMKFPREFHAITLWQPYSAHPGGPNKYLGISSAGLELFSDNDEPPRTLLLRHKSGK